MAQVGTATKNKASQQVDMHTSVGFSSRGLTYRLKKFRETRTQQRTPKLKNLINNQP